MVAELKSTALYHVLTEIQDYWFSSLEELFENKNEIIHYPGREDMSYVAYHLIE